MDKQRIADRFNEVLEDVIVREYKDDYNGDMSAYRPSSLSGCSRKVYYEIMEQKGSSPTTASHAGILESGTSRHEIIQNYVQQLEKHHKNIYWIQVENYLKDLNIQDVEIVGRNGDNEVRCYHKKYGISFAVDGILKIGQEFYLLEIKTETFFKYKKHDEPHELHKKQANAYCLCLGLSDVLFLYENRDNCTKKTMYYEVTQQDKQDIVDKIDRINKHMKEKTLPAKCNDKRLCKYCDYKKECREAERGGKKE